MELSPGPSPPQHPIRVTFTETFDQSQFEGRERYGLNPILAKSIVDNRPQLIVEQHKPISSFNEEEVIDPKIEVQKSGVQYRQKYDKVKTQVQMVEEKIKQYKIEQERLQQQMRSLESQKQQTKDRLLSAEVRVVETAYRAEQSTLRMDSNEYCEGRLKKDILYYKKNIFEKNLQLMKRREDVKRAGRKSQRQARMSLRCRTLLSSVEKTLTKNREQREEDLNYVSRTAGKKMEYSYLRQQQQFKIQNQVLSAIYERTPTQKQERKLLLTHKLLKKFLHDKMQKLMEDTKGINDSFVNIKKSTNIKNAEEMVERFLKKDETYGRLLDSVSTAELKIAQCKEDLSKLKKKEGKLQKERDQIEEMFESRSVKDFERKSIELGKLNDQLLKNERNMTLWKGWGVTMVAMMSNTPKNKVEKENIPFTEFMQGCLKLILKLVEAQREKDVSLAEERLKKQAQSSSIAATEILKRNVRIRTMGEDSGRKEDEEMEYDLISEKDFLQVSRRMVKKQRYTKAKHVPQRI